MRDLVPRKSPIKKNTVTPWSTYIHVTPIKLPKNRPSLSPSPVAPSRSPVPPSPMLFGPTARQKDSDRETPSILEYPHESTQLPRRSRHQIRKARAPIEVIEEFIKDLSLEQKEAVRSTYNGPDWPGRKLCSARPSLVPSEYGGRKSMAISSVSTLLPPLYASSIHAPSNRFLVGLPTLTPPPAIAPQVVYHYFPRGC